MEGEGKFKPSINIKKLYYFYAILVLLILSTGFIPALVYLPMIGKIVVFSILIVIFGPTFYWIPKYYDLLKYEITDEEIIWSRGVWFKRTGIVSFNRITNIDIDQGPVQRLMNISSIKVQTAGYSVQSGSPAELKIIGVENPEHLKELIMSKIRGKKPISVETYEEDQSETELIDEIVKIRKILEEKLSD